jgi:hypothetical protein
LRTVDARGECGGCGRASYDVAEGRAASCAREEAENLSDVGRKSKERRWWIEAEGKILHKRGCALVFGARPTVLYVDLFRVGLSLSIAKPFYLPFEYEHARCNNPFCSSAFTEQAEGNSSSLNNTVVSPCHTTTANDRLLCPPMPPCLILQTAHLSANTYCLPDCLQLGPMTFS